MSESVKKLVISRTQGNSVEKFILKKKKKKYINLTISETFKKQNK